MGKRVDGVIALALAALVVVLYGSVVRFFWMWDDAYLLHIAATRELSESLIGTSVWRAMPQQLFTPMLTISYDLALSAFGANPRAFYLAHLAQLMLLVAALYLVLRLWLSRFSAAGATIVFLSGVPLVAIAAAIMLTHYVQSLLFAAIAVGLFTLSVRRQSYRLTLVSSFFYLLAVLAKEIAVGLPLLLLLLPEKDLRERLRHCAPHAGMLFVYFGWRYLMLGQILGGSGWSSEGSERLRVWLMAPIAMTRVLSANFIPAGVLLISVIALGALIVSRSRTSVVRLIVAFGIAIGPVLPAMKKVEPRYALATWLCCAVIAGLTAEKLPQWYGRAYLVLVVALAVLVNRGAWQAETALSRRMSAEARAFLELGAGDVVRNPAVPPAAMNELKWLKEEYLQGATGSGWFYDDLFLCETPRLPHRVFEWRGPQASVVDVTDTIGALRSRYCSSIRFAAPLSASFRTGGQTLSWKFGPYQNGTYSVIIANGIQSFVLPAQDSFRLPGVPAMTLRVKYTAPTGWTTYSPELSLELTRTGSVEWRR